MLFKRSFRYGQSTLLFLGRFHWQGREVTSVESSSSLSFAGGILGLNRNDAGFKAAGACKAAGTCVQLADFLQTE